MNYERKVLIPRGSYGREDIPPEILRSRGIEPVYVSPSMSSQERQRVHDQVHGYLFPPGVEDIDPETYGQKRHPSTSESDTERDKMLFDYMNTIFDGSNGRPYLGICIGMQVRGIHKGGDFNQHIPDRIPNHLDHRGNNILPIGIKEGSLAADIFQQTTIFQPHSHHQEVVSPGEGLVVSGVTSDAVVEIIEGEDPNRFDFSVQFHPHDVPNESTSIALFDRFAREVRK